MSLVWKYFLKTEHKNIASCNLCAKEVKTSGTTSNLLAHLKTKHLFAFEKCTKKKKTQEKIDLDEEDILENVDNPNQNKSNISECNRSRSPFTVDSSSVSFISSHSSQSTLLECVNKKSSFEEGGSKHTAHTITKALVHMICRDNMPTRTVEKKGFIYYTKTLCPLYKLPSRSKLPALIEEKYKMCRSQLKKILDEVHYVSLTSDICTVTSSTRSFLVITGHFINSETSILQSSCLEALSLTERHTANTIVEQFHRICEEFSLNTARIVSITTDGAANMQKAVELFADSKWVWCFAHITNLVVQTSLKNTAGLDQIISQIKHIVTYFKHSTIASDALRAEQLKHGKSEGDMLYLTQDISTRWNSTLEMLDKFEKLAPVLGTILASKNHNNGPQMVTGSNIEVVSEIIHLLAPFKEATVQISAEKYVTASVVLPLCHNVLDTLHDYKPTTSLAIKLKENLLKEIEVKYIPLEKNKLLTIATLLDPRFKRVYSFSSLRQVEAISQISREIKALTKHQGSLPILKASLCNTVQGSSNSIWIKHEQKVQKYLNEYDPPTVTQMPDELKLYFKSATLTLSNNPIKYWHKYKEASPALTEVALKYLTIMGSSVASERIVSAINNVVTDKRSRLTSRHIKEAVFLNSYLTQETLE